MEHKSEFYTLRGYKERNKPLLTESMEDYLEMAYRTQKENARIRINSLAKSLNVSPSSVSKMMNKLKNLGLVTFEKYGDIYLTEHGTKLGSYLLWRHDTLVSFLTFLNEDDYHLEQVEKLEHFIDDTTLLHMNLFLINNSKNNS